MEQILLILLGAFIALGASLVTLRYQNKLTRQKEDRELLHESFKILVILEPDLDNFYPTLNNEQKKICNELLFNASKICNKNNHDLAIKLIEFAEIDGKKTKNNLLSLKKMIIKKCKKPLFIYQRKESKIWKSFGKHFKYLRKVRKKEQKQKNKGNSQKGGEDGKRNKMS